MNNNTSVDNIFIDILHREISITKRILTVLIIICVILFASLSLNVYLLYERLQYEVVTETTTTEETYDYDISGSNNEVVNGNQYNDQSVHNDK